MIGTSKIKAAELPVEKWDILDRTFGYALRIVQLYQKLEKADVSRILGKQLLRAGTSVGANVQEAQGGQSKADFISKISIAQKECLESLYWLRLLEKADLISKPELKDLIDETGQLAKILSSILISSKRTP